MGTVTASNFARAFVPAVPHYYGLGYDRHDQSWRKFFKTKSTKNRYEEDVLMSGTGYFVATAEGDTTTYDDMREGYQTRYTMTDYRLGIKITANAIDDNHAIALAKARVTALGDSWAQTENVIAYNVLNRSTTAGYTGGDGVVLASASHPTLAGNRSNILSTAAALSEDTLEQIDINLADTRDNRGLKIKVTPKAIVCGESNKFEAHRILNSVGRVNTSDNDTNALKDMGVYPGGVICSPYMDTGGTGHFMVTTSEDMQGFTMFVRKPLTFSNDTAFDSDNALFKAHARVGTGFTDWRCCYDNGL